MAVNRIMFMLVLLVCGVVQVQCSDEKLKIITKLPRNPLMKYTSYSSVMILHFNIPEDSTRAVFKFRAKDESTSMFIKSCIPRNVSIHMKPGAYPVINPDGVPLPKTFLNISRPALHELTLQTDLKPNYINISSPIPGDWFAVAFISWTDPKADRIEQQGLTSQCEAHLYAELSVEQEKNMTVLALNTITDITIDREKSKIYKFFVPDDVDHVLITLETLVPCKTCNIIVLAKAKSIPDQSNYQDKIIIHANTEEVNIQKFWPQENTWHYLVIKMEETDLKVKFSKDLVKLSLSLKYISGLSNQYTNSSQQFFKSSTNKKLTVRNKALQNSLKYKQYNMMRLTAPDNFIFEYDFRPVDNGTSPVLLNVTSNEMTVLKFKVYDIIDVGGTMTVGLAIKPDMKTKKENAVNFTVVACLRKDIKEIPIYPDQCTHNKISKKSPIILNNTNAGTLDILHVPYPDPGTYYLSLRAFYEPCYPCNCSEECEDKFIACTLECEANCTNSNCDSCSDSCKDQIISIDSCQNCDCDGICETVNGSAIQNTSLVFSISSHPCIAGRCGKHGRCNHYMAGGFIFSACQCFGGYRGWDCTDASEALSDFEILFAILLLTVSNSLFIPSVYFAFKRSYYTEAVTYFCSMIASTFYHACDSKENQYGFCLFPLGVLQFCDFYCALLAIWVTLVAMAYTNSKVISICHIAGAILLAFGVTYNKHALWVYLMPTISGFIIIGVNWGLQCRKTRSLFPARKYLKLYMPVGAILVVMGLISFAFLETKGNYKIVHSLWHVMMALSLIFLLPNKNTFTPKS